MATRMERRQALLRKMARMPSAIRAAVKQAVEQSADEIQSMQKRLAPVRSGKLRDSIVQTRGGAKVAYASVGSGSGQDGDPDLTVDISAGNSGVRYAHLVEFGTAPHRIEGNPYITQHPGARPRPFFFPAYRALRRRVKSRIARATRKAIREAAK